MTFESHCPRLLALQDGEVDPPEEPEPPSEEQIPKTRPARLRPRCTSFRGSLAKVKSKLSRKKQTTALGHLAALKKVEAQLQASLSKGCLPLGRLPPSSSTKLLEEAAALAKAAREEKKELSHLAASPDFQRMLNRPENEVKLYKLHVNHNTTCHLRSSVGGLAC